MEVTVKLFAVFSTPLFHTPTYKPNSVYYFVTIDNIKQPIQYVTETTRFVNTTITATAQQWLTPNAVLLTVVALPDSLTWQLSATPFVPNNAMSQSQRVFASNLLWTANQDLNVDVFMVPPAVQATISQTPDMQALGIDVSVDSGRSFYHSIEPVTNATFCRYPHQTPYVKWNGSQLNLNQAVELSWPFASYTLTTDTFRAVIMYTSDSVVDIALSPLVSPSPGPGPGPSPGPTPKPTSHSKLGPGAIAGIVVAVAVVIALCIGLPLGLRK